MARWRRDWTVLRSHCVIRVGGIRRVLGFVKTLVRSAMAASLAFVFVRALIHHHRLKAIYVEGRFSGVTPIKAVATTIRALVPL